MRSTGTGSESEHDLTQGCVNTEAGVSITVGLEYQEVDNRHPQSHDATLVYVTKDSDYRGKKEL